VFREVNDDKSFGIRAIAFRIGLEARSRDDREFCFVRLQFRHAGPDEELPHKEVMPRILIHEPYRQPVIRISAAK